MQIQQPNIVGNFLNAYQSGLERQEAQKEAERQRMRQDRSDQMAEQRFGMEMDEGELNMALRRGAAMNEILAGVDERNPQTLEIAKQRYLTTFGGKPEDVAQITMADIPRIKLQTGQTLKELDLRLKQAQIAAANRSNRGGGGGSTILKTAAERAQLAKTMGIDINTTQGRQYILTGQMPDNLPPQAIQNKDNDQLKNMGIEAGAASKIAAQYKAVAPAIEQGFTGPAFGTQRNVASVLSALPLYDWARRQIGAEDRISNNINVYDQIDQASKLAGIEALKGIGGSDTERELLTAMQTGVTTDLLPEENKRRMRGATRAAEILSDKEEMASQWLQRYGSLDPRYVAPNGKTFQSVWRQYQRQEWDKHLKNEARIAAGEERTKRQGNAPVEPSKPIITRVK
jgi:hypothetical protein